MTDPSPDTQQTSPLVVFGNVFLVVGLAIGVTDSFALLSIVFLALGLVLLPVPRGSALTWEGRRVGRGVECIAERGFSSACLSNQPSLRCARHSRRL